MLEIANIILLNLISLINLVKYYKLSKLCNFPHPPATSFFSGPEPGSSLPCAQQTFTIPYLETDESSAHHHPVPLKPILILSCPIFQFQPSGFPNTFLYEIFVSPLRVTCAAHLILHLIYLTILCEIKSYKTSHNGIFSMYR